MLSRVCRFLTFVLVHACASGLAFVVVVCDLMCGGSNWVTTALSVVIFPPMLALEYMGLGLMQYNLPLALLVNSVIWVGTFQAVREAIRTCLWPNDSAAKTDDVPNPTA